MSDPVVELIAVDIQEAVDAITVANGFNQDLSCVRPTRLGFEGDAAPVNGKVVLVSEDPDEDEENSGEGNAAIKAWTQPFVLIAFIIASDTSDTAIDTAINRARSDIEKKLMEDPTRGGNAWDTRIRAPARFNEGPGATGIIVMVDVLYRTREGDPYTNVD